MEAQSRLSSAYGAVAQPLPSPLQHPSSAFPYAASPLPSPLADGESDYARSSRGGPPTNTLLGYSATFTPGAYTAATAFTPIAPSLPEPPQTTRRWVVLLLFSLYNLSNNMQWITFATIVPNVQAHFNCTEFQVNSLGWLYSIAYVATGLPVAVLYDRLGLRNGMLVGAVLNAVGSVLKLGAVWVYPSYATLFIAQLFNALSQSFVLGLPPMVAAAWFGTKERSLATAIASAANVMGVAVGFPMPPLIVTDSSQGAAAFGCLFGIEAAMCVLPALGIALFVRDGPTIAPSATARRRTDPVPLVPTLKELASNRPFIILVIGMGLSNGVFGGISTVMAQINQPFGISGAQTGWIGCIGAATSIIGGAAIGRYIDKMRQYKAPLLALFLALTVSLSAVVVAFAADSYPLVNAYIWYSLQQILISMISCVVFETAVEITYPVPEAISGTVLMIMPNLVAFLLALVSASLLGSDPTKGAALWSLMLATLSALFSGLVTLWLREDLRRMGVERGPEPEWDAAVGVPTQHPSRVWPGAKVRRPGGSLYSSVAGGATPSMDPSLNWTP